MERFQHLINQKLLEADCKQKKQILPCFLVYIEEFIDKRDVANKTVDEIQTLYERAEIPTPQQNKMAKEIEKCHYYLFESILKISIESKSNRKSKKRIA